MNEQRTHALIDFYEKILEAERAGVQSVKELLDDAADQELKDIAASCLLDEGMNCGVLTNLIKNAGGSPGSKTGDFAEKIRALDSVKDKLKLLAKGQEWVAKQIRYNRELIFPASSRTFIEAMKIQHEENVDRLNKFTQMKYPD